MNTTANAPSIGLRVKRWRKRAKLSQTEVAELVDCCSRTIGDMENGRRQPSAKLIARLEELIAIPPDGRSRNGAVARAKPTAPTAPAPRKPAPPVLQGEETTIQHTIGLSGTGRRRATLILPPDLTQTEAARLSALIVALVD